MLATILALAGSCFKIFAAFGDYLRARQLIEVGRDAAKLEDANATVSELQSLAQVDGGLVHLSDDAVSKRLRDKFQRD